MEIRPQRRLDRQKSGDELKFTADIRLRFDFEVDGYNPDDDLFKRHRDAAVAASDIMQAAIDELTTGPVDLAKFLESRVNGRIERSASPHE